MTNSMSQREKEFIWAIDDGELDKIRLLHSTHADLRSDLALHGRPWLVYAVKSSHVAVLKSMLMLGFNVNAVGVPPYATETALQNAIGRNCIERVKLLLNAGASPNVQRPVIACLSTRFPPDRQIELLKVLLEYDADLNRLYDLYGNPNDQFSAFDFAPNERVRNFLGAAGALPSKMLKSGR